MIDRRMDERIKLVISANSRIPISGNAANEFSSRVTDVQTTGSKQERTRKGDVGIENSNEPNHLPVTTPNHHAMVTYRTVS